MRAYGHLYVSIWKGSVSAMACFSSVKWDREVWLVLWDALVHRCAVLVKRSPRCLASVERLKHAIALSKPLYLGIALSKALYLGSPRCHASVERFRQCYGML
jgi:hypothetical protein